MHNAITGDTYGAFEFTGAFSGYDYADMLLGLPFRTNLDQVRSKVYSSHWEVGAYVQDDWKVNPRLTITPGLRFQHYGVPLEKNGLCYNFDLATQRVVVPDQRGIDNIAQNYPLPVVTADQAGYPERLREFKSLLVEPRLGIAYRPFGNTVFRAAYGIYNVPFVSNAAWATANVFGEFDRAGVLAGLTGGPYQLSESFGPNEIVNGVPRFTLDHPFPGGQIGLQNVSSAPIEGRKDVWPYDQQWNITVEHEFPSGISLRTSYVGSKGTHWPYLRNLNVPAPSLTPFTPSRRPYQPNLINQVNHFDMGGNSSHHGLEIEVARQFSNGLYFRGWYGWLKTLNDVQAGLFGSSTGWYIENPDNRSQEKGWQDGTTPVKTRWMAVWDIPVGKGRKYVPTGWVDQIIGGWTTIPAFVIQSGIRFTPIYTGSDPANVGTSSGRPDQTCDANGFGDGPGIIWDRSCFAVPQPGRYGNTARGTLGVHLPGRPISTCSRIGI